MYIVVTFFNTILACTIPVASGLFIPHFKMGAAFGRLVGEVMAMWFPEGVRYGHTLSRIIPGGYAVVGAAAWSGAVTHTVSTSVIVFELTGQISHILPVMVAVLVSNAVAQALQPSVYDSIILIKKLPYLPDIVSASSDAYNVYVEDIMVTDVQYIWLGATYRDIKNLLDSSKRLRSFPLVDSPESMILLGSIQRPELVTLLTRQLGRTRRLQYVAKRAKQESEQMQADESYRSERRPSRFEVLPAPDTLGPRDDMDNIKAAGDSIPPSPLVRSEPRKSILKKAHSFTARFTPGNNELGRQYATVTPQDSRLRMAFEAVSRKAKQLEAMDDLESQPDDNTDTNGQDYNPQNTVTSQKKVQLPRERIIDMSPEEQLGWEEEQLDCAMNFDRCRIDPAPFQLVERTSLLKVHSLFSLLGLSHAYVTALGRLVGVLALKELRKAIEGTNSGTLQKSDDYSKREVRSQSTAGPSHVHYTSTITSISSMASSCTNDDSDVENANISQL